MRNFVFSWHTIGQIIRYYVIGYRIVSSSVIFSTLLLSLCLFSTALLAATSPNILLLSSYHPGYKWSDQIIAGISDAIDSGNPDITLFVEYMIVSVSIRKRRLNV